MSIYNSNIQTRTIDSVFDRKNFRTEFRLSSNDACYLSNWRLIGMGIQTSAAQGEPYNPILGAWCIDSMQLYDGNQLLDQVLNADLWKAFSNFNNSNDENMSVNGWIEKNDFCFDLITENAANNNWQDWNTGTDNLPKKDEVQVITGLNSEFTNSTINADQTAASWLALKGFLPFLSSSLYVPSAVYKNLRLVINWKNQSQLKEIAVDPTQTYNTFENTSLIVDMVMDEKSKKLILDNYQGLVYKAIEHDRVQVNQINPSAGTSQVQNNRFLVNGFNNKTVEKLVVVQSPTDPTTYQESGTNVGIGAMSSMAQLNNTFQFRVNGQNKLPRDGFTRKNQRLAALVDTYGECVLPTSCNFVYVPNANPLLLGADSDGFVKEMQGHVDWTAIEIREPVKELIVEYSRTGVHGNADLNQSLRLNLFGECVKAVSVNKKDMSYVVQYL